MFSFIVNMFKKKDASVETKDKVCNRCYGYKTVRVQHGYFSKTVDCPKCCSVES